MLRRIAGSALACALLVSCGGDESVSEEIPAGLQPTTTTTQGGDTAQPPVEDVAHPRCTNLRVAGTSPIETDQYPWDHVVVVDGTPTWIAPVTYGSVVMITAGDGPVVTVFEDYDSAVTLDGKLYVGAEGFLAEVDPDTGEAVRTYPVPGRTGSWSTAVLGLASGIERLWTYVEGDLVAVDPSDGTITTFDDDIVVETPEENRTQTFSGLNPHGTFSVPVEAGDRMWLSTDDELVFGLGVDGSVVYLRTGETSLIPVEAEDLLYIANFDSGSVTVIDPEEVRVVDEISVGTGPLWPIEIDGRLWVANSLDDSVTVVNAETGGIDGELQVGGIPSHPLVVGDYIVVAAHAAGTVTVFDRETLEVHAQVTVDEAGISATELFYPSGHVETMPLLKLGLPVAMNDTTVVVSVFDGDRSDGSDLLVIDLPTGRVVDRYPGTALTPVRVDGELMVIGSEGFTLLACS